MTHQDLGPVVDAAQVVTGVIAARARGDVDGARALLTSIDQAELLSGALLVAELSLGLWSRAAGESVDRCAGDLSIELMALARR